MSQDKKEEPIQMTAGDLVEKMKPVNSAELHEFVLNLEENQQIDKEIEMERTPENLDKIIGWARLRDGKTISGNQSEYEVLEKCVDRLAVVLVELKNVVRVLTETWNKIQDGKG